MDINKQQLFDEATMLGNEIYNGLSNDRIAREYSSFIAFNSIIRNLLGVCLNTQIILDKYPGLVKFVEKEHEKSLFNFYYRILSEKDLFEEMFCNHSFIYNESDMITYTCGGNLRNYSVSDAKEIILSYFSEYGNQIYKIVKKYFDEGRVQFGFVDDQKFDAVAFFTGSVLLQKGYVCITHDKFSTSTLGYLAHEFGHVIDKELFYNPQQKKIRVYDDPFNEVPSGFFDWGMLDFLYKNKIDENGVIALKGYHYNQMFYRNLYLSHMIQKEDLKLDGIDIGEDFRTLCLYCLGYDIGLAMNEVASQDRKGYMKYFTNLICSRNEADFMTLLENGGINSEEFINGDILDRNIELTLKQMKKRYNIKD